MIRRVGGQLTAISPRAPHADHYMDKAEKEDPWDYEPLSCREKIKRCHGGNRT